MDATNKEIIKTIKVEDDEIIDCYDIYKQPSLNHHLLQNHILQIKPSSYPEGMRSDNFGTLQLTQIWHKYGSCPEGTIPIRREGKKFNSRLVRKHRHKKLSSYKILNISEPSNMQNNHEYAIIRVQGSFLGAQAKINLWKPVTETPTEISVSQIWVAAGVGKDINTIEAGWEVYRNLYGDENARFFIYWTTDGYISTGCYNLQCNGFVQTTSTIALGCKFTEVSTFNGDQQDAIFSISKELSNGNWWIHIQGTPVGYYPSSLFRELSKTATRLEWGGEISNEKIKGRHTSTQMGSGHFPSEGGFNTSSYFNWVQVVDENNVAKDPEDVEKVVSYPNCYDLKIDKDHYNTNGYSFYYGGPGYNDKCQ